MRVTNINGTSQNDCTCGSWLQHWLNFSHQPLPRYCSELGCLQRPTEGAHVQIDWATDNEWYIVPLCAVHNALRGHTIELFSSATLVPANVDETCGKPHPIPTS